MANAFYVLQAQRERLVFLQLLAFFAGAPRRGDVELQFGIQPTGASRDWGLYREMAPDRMECDAVSSWAIGQA